MKTDALFKQIQAWNGDQWKNVLDAGTGEHSLKWLFSLPTDSLTAITASSQRAEFLNSKFKNQIRSQDCILEGNWLNQSFLHSRTFDVVIADYLLGAVEGFSPYFQEHLFARLHRHCRDKLYIIGLEPFPDKTRHPGGQLMCEITQLRDACILLAGHKCYREYPRLWVEANLRRNGFVVEQCASFPILMGEGYMHRQLQVCQNKLTFFRNRNVAREMLFHITNLKNQVSQYTTEHGPFFFGEDYVIAAKKQENQS